MIYIRCLLAIIACCLVVLPAISQQKYWVCFKDKKDVTFSPDLYFSREAQERRQCMHLPAWDIRDVAVNPDYISEIQRLSDSMGYPSRWLNAQAAWISDPKKLSLIKQFPFVKEVIPMQGHFYPASGKIASWHKLSDKNMMLLRYQEKQMGLSAFQAKKLDGKGIRIAILDVGFSGADHHPALQNIFKEGRVKGVYDFIGKNEDVYGHGEHGTSVLSCIAGIYDSLPMGVGIGAEFLLARTERLHTEWRDEEDSWVAAAEWADKNGARIINSSLGYTFQRYFVEDMTGHKSLISKAANAAASKGILVVIAAGNEGLANWKGVATPGDADSALTIGGLDPEAGFHIDFSSYGPNYSSKLKPNLIAPGTAIVATASGTAFQRESGTSFAAPLVAGFAACIAQLHPDWSGHKLYTELEKSGNLQPYFDYAHGYGTPRAAYFFEKIKKNDSVPPYVLLQRNLDRNINGAFTGIRIHLSDTMWQDSVSTINGKGRQYVYWSLADAAGRLTEYNVIRPNTKDFLLTPMPGKARKLRVFYKGFYTEMIIK